MMKKNQFFFSYLTLIFSLVFVFGIHNTCDASESESNTLCYLFKIGASADKTVCKGQSVTICGEGAYHYRWSNGSHHRCITVNPYYTKTYSVKGYKGICSDVKHVKVRVNDSFNFDASSDKSICRGQSVEICGDRGADHYRWSNGSYNRCISVSPYDTKTYTVKGSKDGCEGEGHVKVRVNDSFRFDASSDKSICRGQSVEICGEGADQYRWNNGSNFRCITVSPYDTKTYSVKGYKDGCEGEEYVRVNVDQCDSGSGGSNIDFGNSPNNSDNSRCAIDGISLSERSTSSTACVLSWTNYSDVSYNLHARIKGNYNWHEFQLNRNEVELYNLDPCTTYEWAISMNCSNGKVSNMCDVRSFKTSGYCNGRITEPAEFGINLSIDEANKLIQVHPNPATDWLQVYYNDLPVENLSVFSASGKLIEEFKADGSGIASIEVNNYTSGIYLIMLQAKDKLYKNVFIVD